MRIILKEHTSCCSLKIDGLFREEDDLVPEIRRVPMQGSGEGSLLNQPASTAVAAATQTQPVQQALMPQQVMQPQVAQPLYKRLLLVH